MRELLLCFVLLVAGVSFGDPAPSDVRLFGKREGTAGQQSVISQQPADALPLLENTAPKRYY